MRSYNGKVLQEADIAKINDYLSNEDNMTGGFGNLITLKFKGTLNLDKSKKINLGTYGFSKGHTGVVGGFRLLC